MQFEEKTQPPDTIVSHRIHNNIASHMRLAKCEHSANSAEFRNYTLSFAPRESIPRPLPSPFIPRAKLLKLRRFHTSTTAHSPYIRTFLPPKLPFESFPSERLTTNWQSARTSWKLVPTELTSLFRLPLESCLGLFRPFFSAPLRAPRSCAPFALRPRACLVRS